MLYFIFDLDYTLYNVDKRLELNYSYIKEDKYTNFLLQSIPFDKYVFTNGILIHAKRCLEIMKMTHLFKNIVARDTINDLKPRLESYNKFMKECLIENNDKCIFFEDTLDNLKTAKEKGWYTVYIGELDTYISYVDLVFPTLNDSLEFFVKKIKL
mgnify:CR=1 FL=1